MEPPRHSYYLPEKRILSAILTFALPIIDTTVVFFNRILKGTSPFKGGKDHTTHHLYYLGLNEVQIAVLYILYTGICLSCVVIMNKLVLEWSSLYSIVMMTFFHPFINCILYYYPDEKARQYRTLNFIKKAKCSKK